MKKWAFIFLILVSGSSSAQLIYNNLFVDYDSSISFGNLRVIPVRHKPNTAQSMPPAAKTMVSFSQAMASGLITVEERGTAAVENVHWLSLYNNSDRDVFISSGEVLEGGRQDRIVTRDTIVMAKTGRIDLPVMCVEEGRWSNKSKKFVYRKIANPKLRKNLDLSKNQVLLWKEINIQLDSGKVKNTTNSYLARTKDKKYTAEQNAYWQYFEQKFKHTDSNIAGLICVSGDRVIASDIFISSNLFYGQLHGLMQGYIEEAIVFGKKPVLPDAAVKLHADKFLTDEASQTLFAKKYGKQFKAGGQTFHLSIY